jgi:hypothetical protein
MTKWMTAVQTNMSSTADCIIQSSTVEVLALNKQYVPVDYSAIPAPWTYGGGPTGSMLYVETDQAHGTQVLWETDFHANNDWGAEEVRTMIQLISYHTLLTTCGVPLVPLSLG